MCVTGTYSTLERTLDPKMAAGDKLENLADGWKRSSVGFLRITFLWDDSVVHDLHVMPTSGANTGSSVTFMEQCGVWRLGGG